MAQGSSCDSAAAVSGQTSAVPARCCRLAAARLRPRTAVGLRLHAAGSWGLEIEGRECALVGAGAFILNRIVSGPVF